MLLLPATITAFEAADTQRLLTQALRLEAEAAVVVDASNLKRFDTAALAVLLECERQAAGRSRAFAVRGAPAKLVSLAKLYGVDGLLGLADDKLPPVSERGAAPSSGV